MNEIKKNRSSSSFFPVGTSLFGTASGRIIHRAADNQHADSGSHGSKPIDVVHLNKGFSWWRQDPNSRDGQIATGASWLQRPHFTVGSQLATADSSSTLRSHFLFACQLHSRIVYHLKPLLLPANDTSRYLYPPAHGMPKLDYQTTSNN